MKEFSFHAGKREDGHVDHDDNRLPKGRSAAYLITGRARDLQPFIACERPAQFALFIGHPAQAIFHDDHRAINDDAEINRAQTHEIAADAEMRHAQSGQQHGERDCQGGEECRTEITQQRKEHDYHEHGTVKEVVRDGVDGVIHQSRAVEHGACSDPRR